MSLSLHTHICTHTQPFPKIADGLFSWTYIISRWRSWIKPDGNKSGETGNLKKQKRRGMELSKENNLPPPPLIPWTLRKNQVVNYTVKNRETVYHTRTCGQHKRFKSFTTTHICISKQQQQKKWLSEQNKHKKLRAAQPSNLHTYFQLNKQSEGGRKGILSDSTENTRTVLWRPRLEWPLVLIHRPRALQEICIYIKKSCTIVLQVYTTFIWMT